LSPKLQAANVNTKKTDKKTSNFFTDLPPKMKIFIAC
jgi:hypothetical protein